MNRDERQLIEGLFGRLQDAERTAPPRDAEADAFIGESVARQPGAPYYMAQTIIVQEQALEAAQARIQELEAQAFRSSGGGGLFGSLFGSGSSARPQQHRPAATSGYGAAGAAAPAGSPWNSGRGGSVPAIGGAPGGHYAQRSGGGGFLAGAAQTAVGVAGGMMLGSMLGGMFAGDAEAAETDAGAEDAGAEPEAGIEDAGMDDLGGDMEF